MATQQDHTVFQGDTLLFEWAVYDIARRITALSDYMLTGVVRDALNDTELLLTISANPDTMHLTLELSNENTSSLTPGSYQYRVQASKDGKKHTVGHGTINILRAP